MFGRRVFASAPIPRAAWASLHIQSAAQAARRVPSLALLAGPTGKATNILNSLASAQARDGMAAATVSVAVIEEMIASMMASTTASVWAVTMGGVGPTLLSWHMPTCTLMTTFEMRCHGSNRIDS